MDNFNARRLTISRKEAPRIIDHYLAQLGNLPLKIEGHSAYALLLRLKREPIGGGPYPKVSPFETANRVLSDLIILFGVKLLLSGISVADMSFPFNSYSVALGTQSGTDVLADEGDNHLLGEAFNVAPTFYQTKRAQAVKRLRRLSDAATHRVVLFNEDAVSTPSNYPFVTDEGIAFIPVRIEL
jgi:hypothetical protein